MYTADIDGIVLLDVSQGVSLEEARVEQELNKVGSLTFTIRPGHQAYGSIGKMSSVVTVRDGSRIVFRGRVLDTEEGFSGEVKVTCESDLAYLLDTRQRPYDYQGSLVGYLTQLVQNHNAKVGEGRRFSVGNVTVTDSNDYVHYSSTEYPTTWDEISDKLIDTHGGYVMVRYGNSVTYIDYLDDITSLSTQGVDFGVNLLDLTRSVTADDLATVVIPLGAKLKDADGNDTDERLTIADANDGLDYLADEEAVEAYGWIETVQTWDDVTLASNLKQRGAEYLAQVATLGTELEISAVDLAGIRDGADAFRLGSKVRVTSGPHELSGTFVIDKISIDLLDPSGSKLTIGSAGSTMSDIVHDAPTQGTIDKVVSDAVSDATSSIEQKVQSAIEQAADSIKTEVSEEVTQTVTGMVADITEDVEQAMADASTAKTEAETAAQQAAQAIGISNGKADVLIQDQTPSSDYRKSTTLWIDTTDGNNTPKRWDGSAWVAVNDREAIEAAQQAAEAAQAAEDAQSAADSAIAAADQISQTVQTVTNRVTTLEQTAEGFELNFQTVTEEITDLGDQVSTQYYEQLKYIRFIDGEIWLGRDPDPGQDDFKAVISNEKISFRQNGVEVAYLSNNTLYVTSAQILSDMQLGAFAFFPRQNGSLSFRLK